MACYKYLFVFIIMILVSCIGFSQVEVEPWGNITGIRTQGQLMAFETNISVVSKYGATVKVTAKEKQRPKFSRAGNTQIITSNIDSLYFTERVTDTAAGTVHVQLALKTTAAMAIEGVYFGVVLPADMFANASIQLDNNKAILLTAPALKNYLEKPTTVIRVLSKNETITITLAKPATLVTKKIAGNNAALPGLLIPLRRGDLSDGQTIGTNFSIHVSGTIDTKPVQLTLDTKKTGRVFEGLGGNFRLQNPSVDPQVIDYCLSNLRVAWGRVEMPWRFWQPSIDTSGIDAAKAGQLNPRVQKSMEMAQRLYKMGMPVIVTAWFPPAWAITGTPKFRPGADGVWGNPLDHSKDNEIYQSITDYIIYLKEHYGVEVADFSFNESDLGINIRQTGEEHAALIKGLGAFFAAKGLRTKLLLGDNSDANSFSFISPAMADPQTHQYIGAISFHSWRGWEDTTLQKWADAATKMQLPILIGEGSIDAAAWAYPAIFEEQTYALKEINLYTRLLAICEPASILQWQLTSDYSPVAGGGVYGDNSPMRPTQRFWNLKQLASTPKNLQAMPIHSSAQNISCAALGDNEKGIYSIHLVNNAAARSIRLTGLPHNITSLRVSITDRKHGMTAGKPVPVIKGTANFTLAATSYTSLFTPAVQQ